MYWPIASIGSSGLMSLLTLLPSRFRIGFKEPFLSYVKVN